VNDLGDDPLTTSVRSFVEHMVLLHKYCKVVPSAMLAERIAAGQPFPSNTVAIHFDDCYRDILTHAKPVLTALKFPASVFVSSGFVGTERQFPHDERSPWVFENLHKRDVCELATSGFEVGSHTVNHVDLAQCGDETVFAELLESKRDLEEVVGRPVTLFSLPFGQEANTRPGVEELVRKAGYRAMFSAYGGYVTHASHLFDLRRISVSSDARPIDLLMEIEGLSLGAFRRSWRARRLRQGPVQSVLGTADTKSAN
jgi:peptidoglycan/xylan/chitin deacetylase (PgdA/CDA1 family)